MSKSRRSLNPLMAELADAVDSKSAELGSYKFGSCSGDKKNIDVAKLVDALL